MARLRTNFQEGTTDVALAAGDTTISSPALANLPVVAAPDDLMLVLDPGTAKEIVRVTAHASGATTATIQRGQDGTAAAAHVSGVKWIHAPVVSDFDVVAGTPPVQKRKETNTSLAISQTNADVDTALDLTLPAKAGDVIRVEAGALISGGDWVALSACTVASGAAQSTIRMAGAFKQVNEYEIISPWALYTVLAADVVDGKVTLRLRYSSGTSAACSINSDAANPLVFSATNLSRLAPAQGSSQAAAHSAKVRRTQNAGGTSHYTLNSTAWADVDATNFKVTVPAQTGDVLLVGANWRTSSEAVHLWFGAWTVVNGALVNSIAGTDAVIPGWFCHSGINVAVGGGTLYTVQAGDVENDTVTLRLRYKTETATNRLLVASATDPAELSVVNLSRAMLTQGAVQEGVAPVQKRRTAGNLSFNSTAWAAVDTALDISLPAREGEVVEVELGCLVGSEAVGLYFDVVSTNVAGDAIRSWGQEADYPIASNDNGVTQWFASASTTFTNAISGSIQRAVRANEIVNGYVKLRLRAKTNTASARVIHAGADWPLQFSAVNLSRVGKVQPSDPKAEIYSSGILTTDAVFNPRPTADTIITGLELTIPASTFERTFLVFGYVSSAQGGSAGDNVRTTLYRDTTRIFNGQPDVGTAGLGIYALATENGLEIQTLVGVPVTIPGDNAEHKISWQFNAVGTTAAWTFKTRYLIASLVASAGGSKDTLTKVWDYLAAQPDGSTIDHKLNLGDDRYALIFITKTNAGAWVTPTNARITVPTGKKLFIEENRVSSGIVNDSTYRQARVYNITDAVELVTPAAMRSVEALTFKVEGDLAATQKLTSVPAGKEIAPQLFGPTDALRAMGAVTIVRLASA